MILLMDEPPKKATVCYAAGISLRRGIFSRESGCSTSSSQITGVHRLVRTLL
jgi:hypothetical protein